MAKLTLSVDEAVVARAKEFALRNDTSVSKLVEDYLASVTGPSPAEKPVPPILKKLWGSLRHLPPDIDYREELAKKYS